MTGRSLWTAVLRALRLDPQHTRPAKSDGPPRSAVSIIEVQSAGQTVRIAYWPSRLTAAEDLLARDPLGLLKWWKLVVLEAMDDRGPVGITLELINDGRQAILRDQGVEDGVRDVSDQPTQQPPDPIRVLENTRRTLLKLVENIDAAIAASKEPAKSR